MDRYAVISDDERLVYEFLSEGPNGIIKKVVFYQEIDDSFFNIGFGDWDEINQTINDKIRSNNNDRDKVLRTVAYTAIDFIKHHPNATIFATGSTPARTRLYQIGIFANLPEISKLFEVEGFIEDEWQPIQKRRNYRAFMLKTK